MIDDEELRGDRDNPVVQLQLELFNVLERYADVRKAAPGYFAALLVEYADTFRQLDGIDVDVGRVGDEVWIARFNEDTAWIGAPRSGEYGDVDVDQLRTEIDADLEDGGIEAKKIELIDLEEIESHDE
jgi:hypothetical protein